MTEPAVTTPMAGDMTHRVAVGLLPPPGNGVILDAGAGTGDFAALLAARGYRTVAAERSFDGPQRDFARLAVDLEAGLPFRDSSLDGVVLIEVVEHLFQWARLLEDVGRVLVPGGWCVVTTPNLDSLSSRVSVLARGYPLYFGPDDYRDNHHVSPVSATMLERAAMHAGLTMGQPDYSTGRLPIPKLRHWFPLRGPRGRSRLLGDSLVVLLTKNP